MGSLLHLIFRYYTRTSIILYVLLHIVVGNQPSSLKLCAEGLKFDSCLQHVNCAANALHSKLRIIFDIVNTLHNIVGDYQPFNYVI